MGCTNSPLTMVVKPDEPTEFVLNCTPLNDARLYFFAGLVDEKTEVTFASTNEVPKIAGLKVVSEAFEIRCDKPLSFPDEKKLHVMLPYDPSCVADPFSLVLYRRHADDEWSPVKNVATYHVSFDGERLEYISFKKIKKLGTYVLVDENA